MNEFEAMRRKVPARRGRFLASGKHMSRSEWADTLHVARRSVYDWENDVSIPREVSMRDMKRLVEEAEGAVGDR